MTATAPAPEATRQTAADTGTGANPWVDASMDLLERALMPDTALTHALVDHSARARLDDLQALLALVRAHPACGDEAPLWMRAEAHLLGLSPGEQHQLGSSPLFRRWLYLLGRSVIEQAPAEHTRALLAEVGNWVIGLPQGTLRHHPHAEVFACSQQGRIQTWDVTRSLTLADGLHDGMWLVRPRGDQFQARAADGTDRQCVVLPDALPPCLPDSAIAVRNDLPALRVMLDETRTPEREETVLHGRVDLRDSAYPPRRADLLLEAADLVRRGWPQAYADWRLTLRVAVPRMPPAGWRMDGFTLSHMQGAVWIHPGSLLGTLESLVHEQSHVKLRYVEEAIPILSPRQTGTRFAVGWRTDRRPLVGIHEGVYVHIHCALALEHLLGAGVLPPSVRDRAAQRCDELVLQAAEGLRLLERAAVFTPVGRGWLLWANEQLAHLARSGRAVRAAGAARAGHGQPAGS